MLWANDAFCTYFGYKPEEIVGDNIRILMPGRNSDCHRIPHY